MFTRFDARAKDDLVQRFDVTALESGGSLCALTTKPCESLDELKGLLSGLGVPYETLGEHVEENGGHSLVLKTSLDARAITQGLSQQEGQGFSEHIEEKGWRDNVDMMKVRGVLGSIGQGMTFASALYRGMKFDKPAKVHFLGYGVKDPYVEMYSSGTSMLANGINFTYGVQKKKDAAGLYLTKQRINEALSPYAEDVLPDATAVTAEDNTPQTTWGKIDKVLEENSTVTADGLKFGAKYILAKSPRDLWLQRAGKLSQLAKVITFVGKGKDTEADKQLEQAGMHHQGVVLNSVEYLLQDVFGKEAVKKYIDPLRHQAMPVSGLMEFVATGFNLNSGYVDYLKEKAAGDVTLMRSNQLKVAGYGVIMLGLLSKSLAPFSSRKVDKNELYAHIDAAMELLPEGSREEHLPEVISAMRQIPEFGDKSYTELYAELLAHRKEKAAAPSSHETPDTQVQPEMLVGQAREFEQQAAI